MIIKVSKGYISYKGELFGVGETIDIPDNQAINLIKQGIAVKEAGELPASEMEPVFNDEDTFEMEEQEQEEEMEEAVAELPAVEPEQTVSKGKANSKGRGGTRTKKA